MNDRTRRKAIDLIARQIAQNTGYVWGRNLKHERLLTTYATNIVATVERMADVRWKELPDDR